MRHLYVAVGRAIAVIAAVIAFGAAATATASAATWTGHVHGKLLRSDRLISGGTSWNGDFWFTTNRRGAVRGFAVVAYEPVVDVSGFTAAIGYVRAIGGTALGLLGPFGSAASGAVLGQIVGAGVSFRSTEAIRRGPLTGQLDGRRLALHWNERLRGIPYDINFVLASGTRKIGSGTASLRSPFQGAGRLMRGRAAVHSSEARSTPGGLAQSVGSYWIATRVE